MCIWRCGGSFEDVVADLGMWLLIWGCGGSFREVVAHLKIYWLIWRCGDSVGDVVDQLENNGDVVANWCRTRHLKLRSRDP